MVVSDQCASAVRIRSDNADSFYMIQVKRQNTVIFQHNYALLRYPVCQHQMFFFFHCLIGNGIVLALIKQPKHVPCRKKAHGRLGNCFFGYQSLLAGRQDMEIGISAV